MSLSVNEPITKMLQRGVFATCRLTRKSQDLGWASLWIQV